MKQYINMAWALALVPVMAGCAEYFDTANYVVEKPATQAEYEYLNEYQPLKTYIDRAAHPGFLLGTGVNAEEYLKGTGVFLLTNSNFDQVTTGNAMKYASVVADDGTMNFGTVRDFVGAATDAGLQVYGHTLCWHEQQNVKWLNSLIADKEIPGGGDPYWESIITNGDASSNDVSCFFVTESGDGPKAGSISDGAFVVNVGERAANDWDSQFFIRATEPLKEGDKYHFSMQVRTDSPRSVDVQAHGEPGAYHHWSMCKGGFNATEEWTTYESTGTIDAQQAGADGCLTIAFNLAKSEPACKFYFKDIVWEVERQPKAQIVIPVPLWEPDFSTLDKDNAIMGWGNGSTRKIVDNVLELTNPSKVNSWEAQAGKDFDNPMEIGTKYFLKLKVKGSQEGSIGAVFQNPDNYAGCGDFNRISLSTEWKEVVVSVTCNGENARRFLFNYGDYEGTVYIESLSLYYEKVGNTLPLTPEEKAEVLTDEMERWVKGMMEATAGKVKAWDVVNEPLSGRMEGDRYGLQHAATTDNPANKFFWQDYLGDNYVRVPIKFARQYFAENGGNPDELKLFINDYNLESDWDDNQKLKSLIKWIEQWESDGETKIDGIGTQMHVSCYMKPETQKSKEDHIVKMFELMASTGKLVRITELDMGLVDANGQEVKTADVTFEQQMAMSNFYKFIVEKYFEIIPVSQQYGICAWAQTDSPEGSGWRAGCPIGLWDLNYSRKPAYGGFADGLQGK